MLYETSPPSYEIKHSSFNNAFVNEGETLFPSIFSLLENWLGNGCLLSSTSMDWANVIYSYCGNFRSLRGLVRPNFIAFRICSILGSESISVQTAHISSIWWQSLPPTGAKPLILASSDA